MIYLIILNTKEETNVSKKSNSGCGTIIVVLLIIGFISEYWPIILCIVVVPVVVYFLYKWYTTRKERTIEEVFSEAHEKKQISNHILCQNAIKTNEDELILSAGRYVGGRDIKTGIYDLIVISGNGIIKTNTPDSFWLHLSFDENNSYNNLEISNGIALGIDTGMRVKLFNHRNCVNGEKIQVEEAGKPPLQFDSMDGHSFEYFCADVLSRNGYSDVKVTQGSGDQGVDILAERDNIKYAIQCKHYSQPVGNKAVQEIYTGMRFYRCHVGIIMTNNYFTQSAKDLAKENGIVLWDRDYLLRFLGTKEKIDTGKTDMIKDVSPVNDALAEIEEDYKGDANMYDREKGIYPPGHYVVGRDIPKGSYYLTAKKDESGSVELYAKYSDYKEDENSVIFENFSDDFFLSLNEENGYLIVTRADIKKV